MYVLLAERKAALLKTTHVLYGPYTSRQEAEGAKAKLASLLEPYGDTTLAIKELIPSVLGVESDPVPHVCPPPVVVPYPWPCPYLPPSAPTWRQNWIRYNQPWVCDVSTSAGPAVGLATGA